MFKINKREFGKITNGRHEISLKLHIHKTQQYLIGNQEMVWTTSFIANYLEVNADLQLPCQITEQVILRKPNDRELSTIKALLQAVQKGIPHYELICTEKDNTGGSFEHITDRTHWRYYVLYDDDGRSTQELEKTLRLLTPSIELAFHIICHGWHEGKEQIGYSMILPWILERHIWNPDSLLSSASLDLSVVEELRHLIKKKAELGDDFPYINNALNIFNELYRVTDKSNLKILGYFSVIEALVTHKPRSVETLDSILHQIQGKLILLEKRFSKLINENEFFNDLSPKNIWKKLYDYRSSIAHGEHPDFSKDFSNLKNISNIMSYLELICKQLLILSFNEPQLLQDLREC